MVDFIFGNTPDNELALLSDNCKRDVIYETVKDSPGMKTELAMMYRQGRKGPECTWANLRAACERLIERQNDTRAYQHRQTQISHGVNSSSLLREPGAPGVEKPKNKKNNKKQRHNDKYNEEEDDAAHNTAIAKYMKTTTLIGMIVLCRIGNSRSILARAATSTET